MGMPVQTTAGSVSTISSQGPSYGSVLINPDGTISYTPNLSFVGIDTVRRIVCVSFANGDTYCDMSFMIIIVKPYSSDNNRDTTSSGNPILVGTPVIGGGGAIVSVTASAKHGTTVVESNGAITYTPSIDFVGLDTITRIVCVTYPNGTIICDTALYIVTVNNASIAIQNYISPNGDGVNDFWNLDGLLNKFPNAKVLVYNRWGNVVWRSIGPYGRSSSGTNVWYGQQGDSKDNVPDGVYYYLIELENEYKSTKSGFVEVMRH
jgi:gliding motility-associated-like protein